MRNDGLKKYDKYIVGMVTHLLKSKNIMYLLLFCKIRQCFAIFIEFADENIRTFVAKKHFGRISLKKVKNT